MHMHMCMHMYPVRACACTPHSRVARLVSRLLWRACRAPPSRRTNQIASRRRVTAVAPKATNLLSPAWDMVVGGSLQWLPARVMSDLPRWHTQRCGRCQNSRYLHGQTRALPLSSSTCSARTSPSTILHHRPPVTRFWAALSSYRSHNYWFSYIHDTHTTECRDAWAAHTQTQMHGARLSACLCLSVCVCLSSRLR